MSLINIRKVLIGTSLAVGLVGAGSPFDPNSGSVGYSGSGYTPPASSGSGSTSLAGRILAGDVGAAWLKEDAALLQATTLGQIQNFDILEGFRTQKLQGIPDPIPTSARIGDGAIVHGVNTMTGRHNYSVALGGVTGTGGVGYGLTANYSALPANFVTKPLVLVPTSSVGYGWTMELPNITVDHKNTAYHFDDTYFANLGTFGRGQLVTDGITGNFQLSTNPSIKLRPDVTSFTPANPLIQGWRVDFPDGTVMMLGCRPDAKRTIWRRGVKVAGPLWGGDGAADKDLYIYRWDVTEIRAPLNRGLVRFTWTQTPHSGTPIMARESWPNTIETFFPNYTIDPQTELAVFSSSDPARSIEKAEFTWLPKGQDEVWAGYTFDISIADDRYVLDTRYLDKIRFSAQGKIALEKRFQYAIKMASTSEVNIPRRYLTGVQTVYEGTTVDPDQWWFDYENASGWLSKVVTPEKVEENIAFGNLALPAAGINGNQIFNSGAGGNYTVTQVATNINPAGSPCGGGMNAYTGTYQANTSYSWSTATGSLSIKDNSSTCVGAFCYVISFRSLTAISNTSGVSCSPIYATSAWDINKTYGSFVTAYQAIGSSAKKVLDLYLEAANSVKLGDAFFVAFSSGGSPSLLRVYNWNGTAFTTNNLFGTYSNGLASYSPAPTGMVVEDVVIGGSDYFVVLYKQGNSRIVVPYVRDAKSGSGWRPLNWGATCGISATNVQSGNLDLAGDVLNSGCLSFQGTSDGGWSDVFVSANPAFFAVLHQKSGTLLTFHRNGAFSFLNTTDRMKALNLTSGNEFFGPNRPWDSDWGFPLALVTGPDYVAATYLKASSPVWVRYFLWRWDGGNWVPTEIRSAQTFDVNILNPGTIHPMPDGITLRLPGGEIERYSFNNSDFSITSKNSAFSPTATGKNLVPRVTGSTNYTAVQYFSSPANGHGFNPYPASDAGNSRYLSKLIAKAGWISSDLDLTGTSSAGSKTPTGLYDIEISPEEDWMIGTTSYVMVNSVKRTCSGMMNDANTVCTVELWKIPLRRTPCSIGTCTNSSIGRPLVPNETIGTISSPEEWELLSTKTIVGNQGPGVNFSLGDGVWMETWGNGSVMNSQIHSSYLNGADGKVVTSVTTKSMLPGTSTRPTVQSATTFNYGTGNDLAFNGSSLTPESRKTVVREGNGTQTLTTTTHEFWVQRQDPALVGSQSPEDKNWVGELRSSTTTTADGTTQTITPKYTDRTDPSWSPAVIKLAPIEQTIVTTESSGAIQTSKQMQGMFDPKSGTPTRTVNEINLGVVDNDLYRHEASVLTTDAKGRVISTRVARFKSRTEAEKQLTATNATSIEAACNPNDAARTAVPVSASRVGFAPNDLDKTSESRWGMQTASLAYDANNGAVVWPVDFSESWWRMTSTLDPIRSKSGEILQVTDLKNPKLPQYASFVYEGVRALPTATFIGAQNANTAALTGEDGSPGLNLGAERTFWEFGSGTTFDPTFSHLGRYSLKVTNDFGPTRNVYLLDGPDLKGGIEVSAWIYSTGTLPALYIQTRDPLTPGWSGAANGGFVAGTWQRWAKRISYSELAAVGMVNPNSSGIAKLRIFAGPATQTGTVWVDDFVVRPITSKVKLKAYDELGRVIGSMDEVGNAEFYEYDMRGRIQASRDDRGRIRMQSTTIPAREN